MRVQSKVIKQVRALLPERIKSFIRPVVAKARLRKSRGTAVHCGCCEGTFRAFLPFGFDLVRPNARCPRCGSLERHRLIARYFAGLSDQRFGASVLHVAPEPCLMPMLHRLGVDYITADLDSLHANFQIDIQDIPFPDARFDVVMCNHVLEHVQDDRAALQELRRVLRPGGWAILQTPVVDDLEATYEDPSIVTSEERQRAFGQFDHVRTYGRDFLNRVRAAGFVAHPAITVGTLSEDEIAYEGLDSREILYVWLTE